MKQSGGIGRFYIGFLLALFWLPVFLVIVYSFNANPTPTSAAFRGFSTEWYRALFRDRDMRSALGNSLMIGTATVFLSLAIGTPAAVAMTRGRSFATAALEHFSYLAILLPEIILGISFLSWYAAIKLPFGTGAIICAHTTFCIPYTVVMIRARLAGFDRSLEEAARDLGANERQVFFTVILPSLVPAIASSAVLCFVMSLDNVIISFFASGPEGMTLPLKIYSLLKLRPTPEINALCAIMTAITLAAVFLASLSDRKGRAYSGAHRNDSKS